ncbi:MAG: hypothetical protein AAFY46_04295, partial [Planctomycetota bacterium]
MQQVPSQHVAESSEPIIVPAAARNSNDVPAVRSREPTLDRAVAREVEARLTAVQRAADGVRRCADQHATRPFVEKPSALEEALDAIDGIEQHLRSIGEARTTTEVQAAASALVERSQAIVPLVDEVDSIADQTNLLALNA